MLQQILLLRRKLQLKYFIAQLNSKIFDWQFKQVGIFLGHAYEWKKQYVEQAKNSPTITVHPISP